MAARLPATMTAPLWKHCSMCNKDLGFSEPYYACSVTTCNRKRTGLYFCSVACWEAHLPMMRHRDAWAEQQKAPSREEWEKALAEDAVEEETCSPEGAAGSPAVRRRVVGVTASPVPTPLKEEAEGELPRDILVVVSKLKQYIRARSGLNTSDTVVDVLSDHLRALCVEAIRNAARDGRKTVMDRDFTPLF